jgi:hypothetical protein
VRGVLSCWRHVRFFCLTFLQLLRDCYRHLRFLTFVTVSLKELQMYIAVSL